MKWNRLGFLVIYLIFVTAGCGKKTDPGHLEGDWLVTHSVKETTSGTVNKTESQDIPEATAFIMRFNKGTLSMPASATPEEVSDKDKKEKTEKEKTEKDKMQVGYRIDKDTLFIIKGSKEEKMDILHLDEGSLELRSEKKENNETARYTFTFRKVPSSLADQIAATRKGQTKIPSLIDKDPVLVNKDTDA